MKLIKRIGCKGTKTSWAIFLCEYCKREVKKQLSSGKRNKSCGCVSHELRIKANIKHSDSLKTSKYHHLYLLWKNIKQRCYNFKQPIYCYYGRERNNSRS